MFGGDTGPRRLLALIDHLPVGSATSGARFGAEPGWSAADEMDLARLNQLILLRRMWADADDADQFEPLRMPWHTTPAAPQSSAADVRAFFGPAARVIT